MSDLASQVTERVRSALGGNPEGGHCQCQPSFDSDMLVVDASDCPGDGVIETTEDCRGTVIDALTTRDVDSVVVESDGLERAYEDEAAALLVAAGRFAEAVEVYDSRLASRATRDPLAAAREATGRADAVSDIAAETGLAVLAAEASDYGSALGPAVGPTLSHWRVDITPPSDGTLTEVRDLDTGATVKQYASPDGPTRYYLYPLDQQLEEGAISLLSTAYRRLAGGEFEGGERAPARAVRSLVDENAGSSSETLRGTAGELTRVLRKHARGYGLLEDLFADARISDAFITAPASENRLRVTVDGETQTTNITLTSQGVDALSSRFRQESGRAFSRADPTLDATAEIADRRLRIAGVTDPPSDGSAFAFRAQGRDIWTLPTMIENGTVTSAVAALLSVTVERGGAILVAGPRGAGKTTLLGSLLWELPPAVRTVVIEDTPELPVPALQDAGRDVQALLASDDSGELSPSEALRTALRLGDGALVVGEVRGEEAAVLYEAMRVGANSEAVMGTIHGDGGDTVYERVVSDLGVSPSAFGVTDLVVTLESTATGDRQIKTIEEVLQGEHGSFEPLYQQTSEGLRSNGRIERGNSQHINGLREPDEAYADVRETISERQRLLSAQAESRSATAHRKA